jgi:glycosyltransferase A (GT-A) superfamily protein (DUF2064 family)
MRFPNAAVVNAGARSPMTGMIGTTHCRNRPAARRAPAGSGGAGLESNPMSSVRRAVVMLSKPSVPGRVKTRLIGELSPEDAADLHRAFVADSTAALLEFQRRRADSRCFAAWALSSPTESLPTSPLRGFRQSEGDLGRRLHQALWRVLESQADTPDGTAIAIGSDLPTLGVGRLEAAFEALEGGAGVVLGPARDGGYYLIGVRRQSCQPRLLAQTIERARELGIEPVLLDEESDIDTAADLEHLRQRLASSPPAVAAATRLVLAQLESRSAISCPSSLSANR